MESPINPWVRANLDTFDADTEALIAEDRRPEYGIIQTEIALARDALGLMYERRYAYFKDVSDGKC